MYLTFVYNYFYFRLYLIFEFKFEQQKIYPLNQTFSGKGGRLIKTMGRFFRRYVIQF